MHITPSSTPVAAPAQPRPSATSRLLESLRSIGNSLVAMSGYSSLNSPADTTEEFLEELLYPDFRTTAEIKILAKKWCTEDIATVQMIIESLPDITQFNRVRITDLSAEHVYLHRAQPIKHTNLTSQKIGNKINSRFLPGDGIFFWISLDKKVCNPYVKTDSIELVCRVSDVLRCGGRIIDDPYSPEQNAVFVKLPQSELIPFVLAKDL